MKILIIRDDIAKGAELRTLLESEGHQVELLQSREGWDYAGLNGYDLLLADAEPQALDPLRQLRDEGCTAPIILLVPRSTVEDRIQYLEAGADYFLVKPFNPRELLCAVRAQIRRQSKPDLQLRFGNTILDLPTGNLICGERTARLSAREMDVARLLFRSGSENLDKQVILARVWGYGSQAVANHVEVYVGFLRKKLRSIGSDVRIESIRRMGYHLEIGK